MIERRTKLNLVEEMSDTNDAWNQPCAYGHLVVGHAVYCHHPTWEASPTKCRRTWYTQNQVRDEDCEGFSPNQER